VVPSKCQKQQRPGVDPGRLHWRVDLLGAGRRDTFVLVDELADPELLLNPLGVPKASIFGRCLPRVAGFAERLEVDPFVGAVLSARDLVVYLGGPGQASLTDAMDAVRVPLEEVRAGESPFVVIAALGCIPSAPL